jgi:hypothetical protein
MGFYLFFLSIMQPGDPEKRTHGFASPHHCEFAVTIMLPIWYL